jgi:hypothetical protein
MYVSTESSKLSLGQTKDFKIGICCFFAKQTAIRSKSKDVLAFFKVTSLGLSRLAERTAPAKVKFKVFLVHYGRHEYTQW